jgi:hypothetical protein
MRTTEDTATAIRERAYHIWEHAGRPDGRAKEHWFQAAQEYFLSMPEPTPERTTVKARGSKAGSTAGNRAATTTKKVPARKSAAKKKTATRRA